MTCNNAKHGQKQRLAKFRKISLLNITISIVYLIMSKILLYSFLRIIFKPTEFYYVARNTQIGFFVFTIGNQQFEPVILFEQGFHSLHRHVPKVLRSTLIQCIYNNKSVGILFYHLVVEFLKSILTNTHHAI